MNAKELHEEVLGILRLEVATAKEALELAFKQGDTHSVKTGAASYQRCAENLLEKVSNLYTE